jgi:adenine-specific DNA-methyltransferase
MLVEDVDLVRLDASRRLDSTRQVELGQFMTPAPTARLMASMFEARGEHIRLLDAGAGVGSLTAAWVAEVCGRKRKPKDVKIVVYELDEQLAERLAGTLRSCQELCEANGIACTTELRRENFIEAGVRMLFGGFFDPAQERFDCAILNPPYRKIHTESHERGLLQQIGVETTNLYTGFLSVVLRLLAPGGEIVAITPRSFCNGPYFRPFRKLLVETVRLKRIHVFESRTNAFRDEDVLQENIIFHGVAQERPIKTVVISSSASASDDHVSFRDVPAEEVVRPDEPQMFIHLVADDVQRQIASRMSSLASTLSDLGLTVSTGRVVDFRASEFLRQDPGADTVPLIYPTHLENGSIAWPKQTKKPNALALLPGVEELLVPNETYVLVKRFSSKEERRRVVAAVHDPGRIHATSIGFENHLNYFHHAGRGIDEVVARGLAMFLNSTLVDQYFRQFNGHTQVNATDLRSLRYPTEAQLRRLGQGMEERLPSQDDIDEQVDAQLFGGERDGDPVQTAKKVHEAIDILKALGFPRNQINERSALTLLALVDVRPKTAWADAKDPLMGITPMMEFFADHYGKQYKPNTRETVRRQTIHQFVDAGLVVANPDEPGRPTNSPKWVYQIESGALGLLRTFGSKNWEKAIKTYLGSVQTLKQRYSRERALKRIPVTLADGRTISLSAGGQNILVEHVLNAFCERFTPGGHVVYVGDTDEKFAYFDEPFMKRLGVSIEAHGKMPDVVVYHREKNWLVLVEAVTSHGPVDSKRRGELKRIFKGSTAGLVFVTAFLDRRAMVKYLGDISWETEVWVADAPDHLIHFNGERFLGPYD